MRASPAAGLSEYKSKAPHTASVRNAAGQYISALPLLPGFMLAQGRLPELVGQTRGSNALTPTTEIHEPCACIQCGMFMRRWWVVPLLGKVVVGC